MEKLPRPEETSLHASTQERERIVNLLQVAFAEGMLDDGELDSRAHAALAAKTRGELYPLIADLAALSDTGNGGRTEAGRAKKASEHLRPAGRLMSTYVSVVERKGHCVVPRRLRSIIFKGRAIIDLTAADVTAIETQVRVTAY